MKLSTAKRRINKTLDELCQSIIDDWYANFKSGYIKGYEDARQGKSPMYAEAHKVADTPQTDYPCNTCANKGDHDGKCKNCVADSEPIRLKTPSNYEPQQTDCPWK